MEKKMDISSLLRVQSLYNGKEHENYFMEKPILRVRIVVPKVQPRTTVPISESFFQLYVTSLYCIPSLRCCDSTK